MKIKKIISHLLITLAVVSVSGIAKVEVEAKNILTVNGAGASFPYPIYSKWFYNYSKANSGVRFNYQSIGSGGGIRQITAKTVDFGASDAPMKDAAIAKLDQKLLHIPTVLGAVTIAYNVPGIKTELKLSGAAVADIFLAKIKKWNDPKIAAFNPGLNLPDADIVVAHRSDGSGTTYVFTDYLSKVSPDWKTQAGTNKSVKWPTGLGGKGNEGVTGLLKKTPYSIGYIELSYALKNKLAVVSLKNKAGKFVKPSIESVSSAAAGVIDRMPADYRISVTDAEGDGSYPISAFTYLLVYEKQANSAKGKAIVDFLKWAMLDGQKQAASLYYAPLPEDLVKKVNATIGGIQVK